MKLDLSNVPSNLRPLSPWAYFGLTILFSIPVVGFIFLIIFSFNNRNVNRRNYARSYFCIYAIAIVVVIIIALTGGSMAIFDSILKS